VALLVTAGPDGALHSRPMVNVNDKFDGDLWFFTRHDDPKVEEIVAHPQVNVAFADIAKNRYVSVAGRAALVTDRRRIELLWTKDCDTWLAEGPDSPRIALLRVQVESAQYWDAQRAAMAKVSGFFRHLVTSEPAQPVEKRSVDWTTPGPSETFVEP
jgi:general stress protein 26